jgi:hypothetical protein
MVALLLRAILTTREEADEESTAGFSDHDEEDVTEPWRSACSLGQANPSRISAVSRGAAYCRLWPQFSA